MHPNSTFVYTIQVVGGEGEGHCWEENPRSIDIEVPIPMGTGKSDLIVEVKLSSIYVALRNGEVILEGPLHGKIIPSESSWTLLPHDPRAKVKGDKVVLSLEKAFSNRDIWATVFDRKFLASRQNE